jgi:hypothetical protein
MERELQSPSPTSAQLKPTCKVAASPHARALSAGFDFVLIFCAIFALHATLLRLPYFSDEAGYFVPAARDILLHGKLIPQTTLSNAHPPLVMLWVAMWWKLGGFAPVVTRTAMLMLAAFGLLGFYRLAERVANRQVALASLGLTALHPVIFAQSSLLQLDIGAFAFTAWAIYFYITGRRMVSISFSALATLSKETAFITPLAFLVLEVTGYLRSRAALAPGQRRDAGGELPASSRRVQLRRAMGTPVAPFAQLLAAVPLLAWYVYHYLQAGRIFNAEYLSYNVWSAFHPLRIPLAALMRLWDAAGCMNLFMLTIPALIVWRLRSAPGGRGPSDAIERPVQGVFCMVIAAYVVALSFVGGAELARYMMPVIPLVIILGVAELYPDKRDQGTYDQRRAILFWRAWCAACAAAFVLALVMSPPWRIASEDNLTYARFVRLHQRAAAYLERHYAHDRILTAWPASDELNRPFLGYVSSPLAVVRITNFTAQEVFKAAQQRQAFDVAFVFSTKYDPPANPLGHLAWWNRMEERFFDYHHDLSPAIVAALLHGRIVWQQSSGGEWAAIIELDEIRNALGHPPPDWIPVGGRSGRSARTSQPSACRLLCFGSKDDRKPAG